MAKVLLLYALSEYPTRNTIEDLLESFKKYSSHTVFYYNLLARSLPAYLKTISFDLILFHQTVTLCGDKNRYMEMVSELEKFLEEQNGVRAALFQDEYFYTDQSVRFINHLKIDYVFSVAPKKEWSRIYEGIHEKCKICSMLTGYIDQKAKGYYKKALKKKRSIDVGYRVVWSKNLVVLGKFGYDKVRISRLFIEGLNPKQFRINIKVGIQHILKGSKWNRFLRSCRYILGVESGSGVLDRDGRIREQIFQEMERNPQITTKELYNKYIREVDGEFQLQAISPRHFEAIEEGACQILYEGEYSGILKPDIHYIALKKDHSNFYDIVKQLNDEEKRQKIVKRAFDDIVGSGKYSYQVFVQYFFDTVFCNAKWPDRKMTIAEWKGYYRTLLHELGTRFVLIIITALKKKDLLARMRKHRLTRMILKRYYAFRY